MEKIKIYVVGGAENYANWINNYSIVHNLEEADVVLFTGGEDVDPSIYGKEKHYTTYSNIERDKKELEVFNSMRPDQVALGICRGSQFLCVANGGLLIQDCAAHAIAGTHSITDGDILVEITSTHHQMQYPFNLPATHYSILFYADRRSSYYEGDGIDYVSVEPEIVKYFVKGKPVCLAIQGHPEIMRPEAPVIKILNNLLEKCLKDPQ